MWNRFTKLVVAPAVLLMVALSAGALGDELELPAVDGIIGFPDGSTSRWFAIRVHCPESHAIAGISWYNNDGAVVFPRVLAGTGFLEQPGSIQSMTVINEAVSGQTSTWSQLGFEQPVAASLDAIYVVFEVPAGVGCTGVGEGGGPGFGYCEGSQGLSGWMSDNGEDWLRLKSTADFAMNSVLVPMSEGMLVKSLSGDENDDTPKVAEFFVTAGPNPFNPRLVIRFGLPSEAQVELEIFDIRGRKVRSLARGVFSAGVHGVAWLGRDDGGRDLASGTYFARIRHGSDVATRKVTLVR